VLSGVLAHVDQRCRHRNSLESSLDDPIRSPGHGHDRSVSGFPGIHIQEFDSCHLPYRLCYRLNDFGPPAFAKIGYTLYEGLIGHDMDF
jgi:hypothetical protein